MNTHSGKTSVKDRLKEKFSTYTNLSNAKKWLKDNSSRLKDLFENIRIRDFVFEPFKNVFDLGDHTRDSQIKSAITQVAIANAVLAGLPGKMGVGVVVSICMEAWMAYTIARCVGIKIKDINDIWKYFGLLAGITTTILFIFKELLGITFSLFSIIPGINPLIFAELIVTNLIGVFFWVGFEEAYKTGSFRIPKRLLLTIKDRNKELYGHQKDIIKNTFTKENLKLVGSRLKQWLSGEIVVNKPAMRGEVFSFVAMAYLVEGKFESLNGPLGDIFITSIRRAYSVKLGDATIEEMSDFFSDRTPQQLAGDTNLVKGEMFEHLIENQENMDGDVWVANLHESRTVPGSDIIFTNIETGQQLEISLKATDNPALIEHALERYPDIPILTTQEVEEYFGDNPFVDYSQFSDVELEQITKDNFERLVEQLEPISSVGVAAGGVTSKALAMLWPFTIAYIRKRIDKDQLQQALVKVLGESGVALASRLSFAVVLGPVFAWYLLARSVILITKGAENMNNRSGTP